MSDTESIITETEGAEVVSNVKAANFWQHKEQIGLSPEAWKAIKKEGIVEFEELASLSEKNLAKMFAALRKEKIGIGAVTEGKIMHAAQLAKFYERTGRTPMLEHVTMTVVKDFTRQWEALESRKEESIEVPKLTKELGVLKWVNVFTTFLERVIGAQHAPLACVARAEAKPKPEETLPSKCYTEKGGSVEGDLIRFCTHGNSDFKEDSKRLFYLLEESVRGSAYASSLDPYHEKKDGRAAYKSFIRQFAGRDKWSEELLKNVKYIQEGKWKSTGNFPLEKHIAKHRHCFLMIKQCVKHVDYAVPLETMRVQYLFDSIESADLALNSAMTHVKADDDKKTGKYHSFEKTAEYLAPYDPVKKNRKSSNKRTFEVSDVRGESPMDRPIPRKPRAGVSGVEWRWYNADEYKKLNAMQKQELHEFRNSEEGKKWIAQCKQRSNKRQKTRHSRIASAVAKLMKKSEAAPAPETVPNDTLAAMIGAAVAKEFEKRNTAKAVNSVIASVETMAINEEESPKKKMKYAFMKNAIVKSAKPPPGSTLSSIKEGEKEE